MIDTPISEAGFFGAAWAPRIMGMRPVADVQYSDFIFCAMDQVVNQIATMRYMSGCKIKIPLHHARAGGRHRAAGRSTRTDIRVDFLRRARHQDRLPGHRV